MGGKVCDRVPQEFVVHSCDELWREYQKFAFQRHHRVHSCNLFSQEAARDKGNNDTGRQVIQKTMLDINHMAAEGVALEDVELRQRTQNFRCAARGMPCCST